MFLSCWVMFWASVQFAVCPQFILWCLTPLHEQLPATRCKHPSPCPHEPLWFCVIWFSLFRCHFHFSTQQFCQAETIISRHRSVAISCYLKASLSAVQLMELDMPGMSSPLLKDIQVQLWSDERSSQSTASQRISVETWTIIHSIVIIIQSGVIWLGLQDRNSLTFSVLNINLRLCLTLTLSVC